MTNNEMDWLVYVYKNAWETKWGGLFQGDLNRFLIFPRGFSLDINSDLAPLPFSISIPSSPLKSHHRKPKLPLGMLICSNFTFHVVSRKGGFQPEVEESPKGISVLNDEDGNLPGR